MAIKFITCYPLLPQGGKTPCAMAVDRQNGIIREMICPDISEEQCRVLAARWNDRLPMYDADGFLDEDILRFITAELKVR